MKDFRIDVHVSASERTASASAQAHGTQTDRPVLHKTRKTSRPEEPAWEVILDALRDLETYTADGDTITVQIAAPGQDVTRWISRGSGIARQDARMRREFARLFAKGVDCMMIPSGTRNKKLAARTEMGVMMGL